MSIEGEKKSKVIFGGRGIYVVKDILAPLTKRSLQVKLRSNSILRFSSGFKRRVYLVSDVM